MLQNRFLLSILLVTASLRVSTAIRCSVCEAEPVVLMTVNGIAFSMDTNLQFSEAPTEYNRAQMQSMTEPMCEESECGEGDVCAYAHGEFSVLGMKLPDMLEDMLEDIEYDIKMMIRFKDCGNANVDLCEIIKRNFDIKYKGIMHNITDSMTEEDKEDLEVKAGACEIESCNTDGCTTEMTREDLGIADTISCYSCLKTNSDKEDNQEDCTQTEECGEGVEQCFHGEMTGTLSEGQAGSWNMNRMYKGCANSDVLYMALATKGILLPGTEMTVTSISLKVCEGNLCEDYEEKKDSAAGITEPRLVLLLISFLFTFLQLNA